MLHVSCRGTGELEQYVVSDPTTPVEVGSLHLGGFVRRAAHPPPRTSRSPAGPSGAPAGRRRVVRLLLLSLTPSSPHATPLSPTTADVEQRALAELPAPMLSQSRR